MRQTARNTSLGAGMLLSLLLSLASCGKIEQSDPQAAKDARAAAKRQRAACGSATAHDRLKGLVFDEAIRTGGANRVELDALADYSFVRMDNPVVEGWDPALEITRCRGRLILEMPAGVRQAFGGERRLLADIDYSAQVAADGNGLVYSVKGAEPVVRRLAGFRLTRRAYQPSPAIDGREDDPGAPLPVEIARADDAVPVPVPVTVPAPDRAEVALRQRRMAQERELERELDLERELARDRERDRELDLEPEPAPVRTAARRREGSERVVRAFYRALGAGNGEAASARVIPEKRGSRAFSPEAITRFYGRLAEPIRLTGVESVSANVYRVRYRYSAGRSKCDGTAVVRLTSRDGQTLIRSIDALSGC